MSSLPLPKGKRPHDQSTAGQKHQFVYVVPRETNGVEAGMATPPNKRRYVPRPHTPAQFNLAHPANFNFNAAGPVNSGLPMGPTMNDDLTIDPRLTQCEPVPSGQQMGETLSLNPFLAQPVHSGDNVAVDSHTDQTNGDNVASDACTKMCQSGPSGRKIAGYAFEKAGLAIPDDADYDNILASVDFELARQEANPPILPPSELKEMAAKPLPEAPYEIPEDNPRLAEILRAKNKQILEKGKMLDKERNNLAAKATRDRRNEVIAQSRVLLNDREAELNWWRLRAITLGAQPDEFENLPEGLKKAILSVVEQRVSEGDAKRSENSAKNKSQRQSTRTAKSNKHVQKDKEAKAKEVERLRAELEASDAAALQAQQQQQQQPVMEPFQQHQQFNQQPGQVAAAA
ncbi:hypothetical protein N0V84_002314 [Fusarium piperis]|uniref:Uncharacterized protein n=1 Tax=Fusarium piperis TaxID=1435070 RepID=A0A9W8WJI7_9HYPO|nr:hypothetical protein N0V84_002314 [Fusarium piperis]